ncbi:MAG: hypothetical protein UW09_C0003G0223 [candidate division TM6 bacterium GW2011_GWF2_43_87]|nr:MAG: hypothetical protein UW09_C0003G0223 [candidate division TM6 bacterium GW2011_GWF2_43_87]
MKNKKYIPLALLAICSLSLHELHGMKGGEWINSSKKKQTPATINFNTLNHALDNSNNTDNSDDSGNPFPIIEETITDTTAKTSKKTIIDPNKDAFTTDPLTYLSYLEPKTTKPAPKKQAPTIIDGVDTEKLLNELRTEREKAENIQKTYKIKGIKNPELDQLVKDLRYHEMKTQQYIKDSQKPQKKNVNSTLFDNAFNNIFDDEEQEWLKQFEEEDKKSSFSTPTARKKGVHGFSNELNDNELQMIGTFLSQSFGNIIGTTPSNGPTFEIMGNQPLTQDRLLTFVKHPKTSSNNSSLNVPKGSKLFKWVTFKGNKIGMLWKSKSNEITYTEAPSQLFGMLTRWQAENERLKLEENENKNILDQVNDATVHEKSITARLVLDYEDQNRKFGLNTQEKLKLAELIEKGKKLETSLISYSEAFPEAKPTKDELNSLVLEEDNKKLVGMEAPVGLINTNNSCWLHAAIQAIAYNPHFQKLAAIINPSNEYGIVAKFAKIINLIDTRDIENRTLDLGSSFEEEIIKGMGKDESLKTQHDSEEALSTILDKLVQNLNTNTAAPFQLKLKTTQKCMHCDTESCQPSVLNTNLRVASSKATLEQSLTADSQGTLEKQCENCKKNTVHTTRRTIESFPDVVIVPLNRTTYDKENEIALKNHSSMKIPLKFNFGAYGTTSTKDQNYRLSSFILHLGGKLINEGHYVTFTSTGDPKTNNLSWWKCNDTEIMSVSESVVKTYLQPQTVILGKGKSKKVSCLILKNKHTNAVPVLLVYTRIEGNK